MYEFSQEYIDFQNSTIVFEKKREDFETSHKMEKINLKINSIEEFNDHLQLTKGTMSTTVITKLSLHKSVSEDFFALKGVEGGIGYFVSETVKNEIENAGCRGIEFQPGEMSFNEWTTRDGLRDQIYGRSW